MASLSETSSQREAAHEPVASADPWTAAMRVGDFDAAWKISDRVLAERRESRIDCSHWPRHRQFIWDGSSFDDKRVLVRCYHGLGDTLQFARFFEPLHDRAREVIVWVQPALLSILNSVIGIDRLLPLHEGAPAASYDVDIESMELAHALRASPATLCRRMPYIYMSGRPTRGDGSEFNVGIAWRSGAWDTRRSIPTSLLDDLANLGGIRLWSLQYPAEPTPFMLPSLACQDIAAMAQAMQRLDLVISVDTMVAHLAGAMGLRTWTLLCREPDWRWMCDRRTSPWYPTMRLFRQRTDDWKEVIDEVATALRHETITATRCIR
jgi:hypothetical protein